MGLNAASQHACFLGPYGENDTLHENLVVELLRDHVYWRRIVSQGRTRLGLQQRSTECSGAGRQVASARPALIAGGFEVGVFPGRILWSQGSDGARRRCDRPPPYNQWLLRAVLLGGAGLAIGMVLKLMRAPPAAE